MPKLRTVEEWAAYTLGFGVEHLTDAPQYCSGGWEGCLDKRGVCNLVKAAANFRAYAKQVGEAVREEAAAALEKVLLDKCINFHRARKIKNRNCANYSCADIDSLAKAIRALPVRPR